MRIKLDAGAGQRERKRSFVSPSLREALPRGLYALQPKRLSSACGAGARGEAPQRDFVRQPRQSLHGQIGGGKRRQRG